MPLLDVSRAFGILNLDAFTVLSSEMVVGSTGQPASSPLPPARAYGVVIPDKTSLKRLDDGTRLESALEIYTRYPLTAGWKTDDVTSKPADVVRWHGRQWVVAMVEDFSAFGAGYLHVACDLLPQMPTSQEPQER